MSSTRLSTIEDAYRTRFVVKCCETTVSTDKATPLVRIPIPLFHQVKESEQISFLNRVLHIEGR